MFNAFTVDLEDWYQGVEIPCDQWDQFEDRIERSATTLFDLLAEHSVRATVFVLGYVAERFPHLVRQIADAGHEIGTHGYSHEFIYKQQPQQFTAELERSLKLLEDITGKPVCGHRAAFFSITRQSLWALDIIAEQGIRYDSSIFPVVNYRYGIPDAPRTIHHISANGSELVEFPLSTLSLMGKNVPVSGGAYFRIFPYWFSRYSIRKLNAQGQPVVFYIHPWELDPDHPRIALPRRIGLPHYARLHSTESKLRRLLRDFQFAPMGEVLGL